MLNHFDECNEFVIRYSRVDLFGLRQEQLSRKKPSIDLCVELQALGVWKHGEQLINSVTNAIPATKRCITTTTTAICNNHNNNNHKRDNVHEMHHQRYISSSSSPIAQSLPITKVISSSSLTAAAAGTTTTMSNLLDQRSISSSHLMPAFVKRRAAAQTATAATNVIATNTTTIVSANLANSNINNNNKSIVPTTTTTSFTRRQKHVDDNEQQQQPRVVPLTQQQQVAVSERRIGSGRLMPRNWDKQDDKQLQQRMNGVNSGGGGGGGGLLMRRNNNQNNYERSTTPTSTANFQQQQQRQQQQRGGAYGKNHHNSYYQRNSNNNNNHHHHHSNVHHSREIEEPEWFSGGPTSQNDTIELRGFDDKDNNDDDDVCNRDIQDDDQDDLQQQKFQSKRINLNDLKCEPKPQQQCDNTKDTDAEDNHHVDDKEPFNLENFLNSDAWEDSINHDESSSHKPMANSRFSQWFMGPKNVEESKDTDANKLNENKLLEFFNDSKLPLILTTDNQTKQQEMQKSFTSVEELEARMLHSDNEKAFVIELQQQQQHKTESSTPQSTENVAAFKKLLEQLSVNDLQQQSQPKGNHNNNMTLMVTLNQSMSAQPTPTATTCTTPMPMATIPPIEMKNFLHFQHQQKLKQQQLLLNGSPTPSVSQLFPVSTLQRVYNEVLCNIHLAFSPDQVQKRIEAQHLYQTIMRGEVSIGFLEQELTNPLLSMHAKDIIAIVVREVTRAISPQMMMVHHIQLRHLAQAASVAAPPSVASVVQPPPLAVPPGNVPTTLITLPILPGAVAPNNKLNVVATPPQTQQQPILLNNNHNNLNKVDFNPEHYTQNLNHHSHHQHHLNNHQQQHNDVQEQQRQQHLNQQLDGIQQQRLHLNCSPIPNSLAFTPTSVLRKMTAEKDIPNNSNDQQQQQPRMILGGGHKLQSQQQPQQPLAIKVPPTTVIGGALCLNEPLQQQQIRNIGRPLLKAPIVTQHILSGQQQQQQQFDDLHHHQQQRLLAMRQQQQQQQQHLMQQQIHLQQQRQHQRNTNLSPTSNQLAQWFSPELLAQASAGKFPTLNMQQTLSLEEFEKNIQQLQQQQTSTTAVAQN